MVTKHFFDVRFQQNIWKWANFKNRPYGNEPNLKQNEIFTEGIIKRIFSTKDGEIDLVTNSTLTKNFLVLAVKTQYKKIEKNSNKFKQYEAKARLNLVNKIYRTFDENLNQKYKVELNRRTIDRVKNSF